MRKHWFVSIFIVCCILTIPVTNARAVGIGAYIQAGSGSSDWDLEDDYGHDEDWELDNEFLGFGFVLDTALARDTLFNYRLQLGYEKNDADLDGVPATFELDGFAMTHDFGFGVLRTPNVRLWLGPELKLAYYEGDWEDSIDVRLFKYGIGPVLGVNVNLERTVTLAVKTGYLFEGKWGTIESSFTDAEADITGSSSEFFVNFAVLFRFGDVF